MQGMSIGEGGRGRVQGLRSVLTRQVCFSGQSNVYKHVGEHQTYEAQNSGAYASAHVSGVLVPPLMSLKPWLRGVLT